MHVPPAAFGRFRDRVRARRDGKRDGQLGIPTTNEVAHPPALMAIAQRADEAVAELIRWWAGEDARLRERSGADTFGLRTSEEDVRGAAADVTEAQDRRRALDAHRDELALVPPTPAGARISTRVYVAAIVAILLAEFPLNAIAFRLFGEAEVLTWVMTAGLAVMLVVCAHGLGTFLRLVQPTMAERRWVWILIAVPVLALIGITLIRARYLSVEAAVTGLNVLGPVVGSLVFLVINLLIYTGATMLSYLAHAPRPAVRRATDPVSPTQAARMELSDAKRRLTEATKAVHRHEEALGNADVARDELLRVARARTAGLVAYYRGLMSVYSAANLRARRLPEIPPVLRELPTIAVPDELAEPALQVVQVA
jgi:hypothetical protein